MENRAMKDMTDAEVDACILQTMTALTDVIKTVPNIEIAGAAAINFMVGLLRAIRDGYGDALMGSVIEVLSDNVLRLMQETEGAGGDVQPPTTE